MGQVAKRQAITNPENTVYSIKRFMGRKYSDPEVQSGVGSMPYHISAAGNGDVCVAMGEADHSPPEVSAMILQKLKADAEAYLGETVTEAVITVPAYFNDAQRQATKDAGRIAGLNVLRIINEPTAASLAYGLERKADEVIAVYDLGGGTFDISILEIGDGTFQVLSTNGNTHLGGDDFDDRVIEWLVDEFRQAEGIDLRQDRQALQRLKAEAEKAKIELSSVQQSEINLPFITADASGPKHLNLTLTRAKLEQLVGDLLRGTLEPVKKALDDAGKAAGDVDEVVLVGGQTRMPSVQQLVASFRQGAPQGRQSRRGGRRRRRHPGGRPQGRRPGCPPAGRDPPHPRHRDAGRRDDYDHPPQHDHPHGQEPGIQHGRRQPAQRRDPRPPGRTPHGAG